MYAKHTIFYDALPHYFMEFDIYDRENGIYLDTPSRREITRSLPVESVPVLGAQTFEREEDLLNLLGKSRFVTGEQRRRLYDSAVQLGLDPDRILGETELSGMMEGLYLKVEEDVPNLLRIPIAQIFENDRAGKERGK